MQTHSEKPYRYAVYFVPPPDSTWWQAGQQWLGRSIHQTTEKPYAVIEQINPLEHTIDPSIFFEYTLEPRRYGWHATLKAPFTLSQQFSSQDLIDAVTALANDLPAFVLPALRVRDLGGFIALRPEGNLSQINLTAARCVTELQRFAAPLSAAEMIRRRKSGLTQEQDRLLIQWGYPWVLDHFKFHLTLTGSTAEMTPQLREQFMTTAADYFYALPPCPFSHIALFIEPTPGTDFEMLACMEMRG